MNTPLVALNSSTDIMRRCLKRISQIVNSLKNFARLDEAEFQQVDIHEGLNSILLLRKSDLRDKINVSTSFANLPPVACYPGELNQVFMNVVSNAIEAIEDPGQIHIATLIVKIFGDLENKHEIHSAGESKSASF